MKLADSREARRKLDFKSLSESHLHFAMRVLKSISQPVNFKIKLCSFKLFKWDLCYFSASQASSFLEANLNCFRKQEAEMETPCDSREGPRWLRTVHPFQGHFAETPYFLVLGWQGVTIKYGFSRGKVIVLNCLSPPLPATLCSLPIYGKLSIIFLFNSNC